MRKAITAAIGAWIALFLIGQRHQRQIERLCAIERLDASGE